MYDSKMSTEWGRFNFRALHLAELSALFEQVVKLARECGLMELDTIAMDAPCLDTIATLRAHPVPVSDTEFLLPRRLPAAVFQQPADAD